MPLNDVTDGKLSVVDCQQDIDEGVLINTQGFIEGLPVNKTRSTKEVGITPKAMTNLITSP